MSIDETATMWPRLAGFAGRLAIGTLILLAGYSFAEAKNSIIHLPKDIPIIEADDRTRACMADMVCVRDIFLKLALGNEHESPSPEYEDIGIVKATGPMATAVIGFDTAPDEAQEAMRRGLMDTLAILRSAGVDIAVANEESSTQANIFILVSDDFDHDQHGRFASVLEDHLHNGHSDYERMMRRAKERGALCTVTSYFEAGPNIVDAALALIPSDLVLSDLRLCFYEEIIQALGPGFDFRDEVMSIFTDRTDVRWFSEFDYLLTRLFFHPMIKPGMSRQQVIDFFPELYQAVLATAPLCPSYEACLEELF